MISSGWWDENFRAIPLSEHSDGQRSPRFLIWLIQIFWFCLLLCPNLNCEVQVGDGHHHTTELNLIQLIAWSPVKWWPCGHASTTPQLRLLLGSCKVGVEPKWLQHNLSISFQRALKSVTTSGPGCSKLG